MNKTKHNITIREANQTDIKFLFNLRNIPDVYKYFKTPEPVEYPEHVKWIIPILSKEKEDIKLYIIFSEKERIGQLRFDIENQSSEISISLLKEYRCKGIAKIVLEQGIEKIKNRGLKKLIIEVNKRNNASLSFFKKFGFIEKDDNGVYKKLIYPLK